MKNRADQKSRRTFLSFQRYKSPKTLIKQAVDGEEKIKMLTPDGQLVEVSRSVIESSKKRKANKEDIHFWGQSNI